MTLGDWLVTCYILPLGMGSPIKGGNLASQLSGSLGMFGGQPNNIPLKTPDSPTMMVIEQNPDDVS